MFDPDMEADDADQIDNQNETKRGWLSQHVDILIISRYEPEVLSSPPSCEWNSHGGTFGMINSVFPSLSLNLIKSVVKETYELENEGQKIQDYEKIGNTEVHTLFLIRLYMSE